VPLTAAGFAAYRAEIGKWERMRLNTGEASPLALFQALKSQVRTQYERSGLMVGAFAAEAARLMRQGYRPLLFANTDAEMRALLAAVPGAREWGPTGPRVGTGPIVANRETHGQGLNMQYDADAIVCRPTRPDHLEQVRAALSHSDLTPLSLRSHPSLTPISSRSRRASQMKGRVDRPGQTTKRLQLTVLMAEHTIEEAEAANIQLCALIFT
jgi:hypothetical protein